jgi:hypothetical protein
VQRLYINPQDVFDSNNNRYMTAESAVLLTDFYLLFIGAQVSVSILI